MKSRRMIMKENEELRKKLCYLEVSETIKDFYNNFIDYKTLGEKLKGFRPEFGTENVDFAIAESIIMCCKEMKP